MKRSYVSRHFAYKIMSILKCALCLVMFLAGTAYAQDDSLDKSDPDETTIPATFSGNHENRYESMYRIRKGIDYPIVLGFGGTAIYLMTIIYSKPNTPEADILKLNKKDVPEFDRWNAGWHDANLDRISYYPFYGVMPLPLLFLADKEMKNDRGKIGVLYLESFAFEGILYSSSVYFVDRFRPDVYDTALPLSYRTNGNFRNSFFAGHVAVVADVTFFMSYMYMSYHPYSHLKWVLYGTATAATVGMAYMRLQAGKHFTSDVITGAIVGVGCGLLTPALHKSKVNKDQKWSLSPSLLDNRSGGFTFTYKL